MKIGEVAKKTGFSTDTIRWYEKIGLIQLDSEQRRRNNYRVYSDAVLDRLIAIRQIKALGFSLKETKNLLSLEALEQLTCASVTPVIDSKISVIDQKIHELTRMKTKLQEVKSTCDGDCRKSIQR